ncbi:MAG TPA: 6-phosphofructokinase [Anaerolineae bacterium]|nr:6-phosphofructokinase [Anaerolineae bacterium]HOR00465.1 6-phosphofructokinase [Anaerolineae bacterium]HPL29325.1 6-phosphofructokinase [Anaerolineae bacterium]
MASQPRNLLVAQSGGPTAVINNSLVGVIEEAKARGEIGTVIGAERGIEGVLREQLVDLSREAPQTLRALRQTPSAALGTSRHKLKEGDLERIVEVFRKHNIGYFCYIGGNDSMDTANRIGALAAGLSHDLRVMGIPKTVDNDLVETDHCPGYGSAARFVAATLRDAGLDTEAGAASTPVKIIEIMGRHAGWLTAASALAREGRADAAPHLIYVPERPVTVDAILADIERVVRRLGMAVVAVSEGIHDAAGHFLAASSAAVDAFGHQQLGGVSAYLADQVTRGIGLKARFEKPDTMQRASTCLISAVDAQEAYEVGAAAVRAMLAGQTAQMVTIVREPGVAYQAHTGLVPLAQVANRERRLPEAYMAGPEEGVTDAFLDYARPLIGPVLPEHGRLARYPLGK